MYKVWTKNFTFEVTKSVQIRNDKCGHFAMYDNSRLKVFFGSKGERAKAYDTDLHPHFLPEIGIPKEMNADASSVQVGEYFWIVGGKKGCGMYTLIISMKDAIEKHWSKKKTARFI